MSHQIKTQLAQKLLTAAENSKNPKAVDLAFEVSKCFTVGFGVSEEVQSMELWLGIAADRGHLEAKFLCTMLGIPGKDAISPESSSPPEKQEPDTISLDLQTSYTTSKERYSRLVLDDIGDFEVYASDDAAAIRSMIHKRLSEGLNIQSFTGTIERSESYALSRAKFPLLHWAAFSGRIELVQVLISFGVNINSIDPRYYRTPLMIALDCAQTAVAELLLHEGADIYQSDRFGVVAPQLIPHIPPRKFSSMVQLFERASKGIQVGNERQRQCCADEDIFKNCEPPLLEAVHLSHPQAVTYVLDKTAHRLTAQEFSTALEAAATGLHANLCSIILAKAFQFCDSLPENPFRIIGSCTLYTNLLFHGRRWPEALEATVKVFLSHGIDINGCRDQDITVLGHAVLSNRPTVASVLKAHGASVEHITRDGLSVLDWAIISVEGTKNIGCVGWLLSCGVPLELLKGKCEPLHMACIHNAFGAAALLLEHQKTDINARSSNSIWDLTPLHSACLKNALETVQLLLSLGADATVVDSYKLTPLEQAVQLGRVEVVEFLLQNHVSIFNTHHVPPRSILAFYVSIREPVRSRTWLLLLDYVQSHAPEVLDGKFTRDRSLLMLATLAKNDHLIPGLIDARAEFTHPHLVGSEWVVMIADSHRIYDQEERGSQHLLEYRKALRAFVEVFEDQGLLLSLNDYGESLLFPAALCSNAVAVGVLLDAGLSALSVEYQNCTVLHKALIGAFHLSSPNPEMKLLELWEDQRPAKVRATSAILRMPLTEVQVPTRSLTARRHSIWLSWPPGTCGIHKSSTFCVSTVLSRIQWLRPDAASSLYVLR